MYVIKGSLATNTAQIGTQETIFPAEHCVWTQTYTDGAYTIDARYVPQGGGNSVVITDAELGFIGKSGRFVQIAK